MKVVYFGTPRFAANVLNYLWQNGVEIVAVITKPDKAVGRSSLPVPTPVKAIAEALLPLPSIFQPEFVSAPEFISVLEKYQADLFVVVAYGEILKQHLLDMPLLGCINLHASLLPKYRGAAPIQRCLIEGEKETGVTIMHMVRKMDAGDIIKSIRVPIELNTHYGELEETLCRVGSELLLEVIQDFEQGTSARTPQDHSLATIAPKIELEDCEIDWKQPCEAIHNLVRGVNPHPGAWCYVEVKGQKKRLKVLATQIDFEAHGNPGEVLHSSKEGLLIACGRGAVLILELQLEGKRAMPAGALIRGLAIDTLRF